MSKKKNGLKVNRKSGFSLVSVLIASGLLGVLALGVIKLMGNMAQVKRFGDSASSELNLKSSIRMILDDPNHCRISLAGNGPLGFPSSPIIFNKNDIDQPGSEGLDIALYLSNQFGDTRTQKKLNGRDNNPGGPDISTLDKLSIKTIKLIMNNGTGFNYIDSPAHNDVGIVRVIYEKKISASTSRDMTIDFDVNLGLVTGQAPDSSGTTRIISCGNSAAGSLPSYRILSRATTVNVPSASPPGNIHCLPITYPYHDVSKVHIVTNLMYPGTGAWTHWTIFIKDKTATSANICIDSGGGFAGTIASEFLSYIVFGFY